ncbi:type I-E CRISPR-associated protein Cse2/CasB [Pseudoalteromonas sp. S558]|jgi:CRISPR system Cascade subunit CasB|uniref:type I-E CRISPR-associated protein Cse2/CasB n=1 Tax=Pseudoalteromonas sp. S558 TaxID=2066515 RepID=UPI00110A318B|nr:type I-E CRISPR-associated protein Cse2/CasB [Pseudoalteromonas sp. S558]TMO02713.1 type I-E CRISPR-associated protein Cse2/CasB [Pseudoalteromonas sp. S558]
MYNRIYKAYLTLPKGDQAELKRCNLKKLANCPAYFRVLKFSGAQDNAQTQRILFLLVSIKVTAEPESDSVAFALLKAGVKEAHIIQITRSGDNAIEYLKRQLIRCENVSLSSLGKLSQYWGEQARRELLKEFILAQIDD